jgi:fumarate hydratase class II
MDKKRIEHDTMGPVEVPEDAPWGAQTQRALENFTIGPERMPLEVVRCLGLIKLAAARANFTLGVLDPERAAAIVAAAQEVWEGRLDHAFPLVVWQSGSGTQTNMNVNEVVARRAMALAPEGPAIHPNDHVNRSQSTNDAFPAAMHMAAALRLGNELLPALRGLADSLAGKAQDFAEIVKSGRTHLMDAAPLTLGQEFSGYAAQARACATRLEQAGDGLLELPLGGTAVGTGLNAPEGYAERAVAEIAREAGLPFRGAGNFFAGLAAHDAAVHASAACRSLAGALMKIAGDLRWAGSGPRCGLAELCLPENEPGSSIMPGKVNPTQCEAVRMACVQVMGLDAACAQAGALGEFELNVLKPLIAHNLLAELGLLAGCCQALRDKVLAGLEPNRERLASYAGRTPMLATALAPAIGYEKAAEVVKLALAEDLDIKAACLRLGLLSGEDLDRLLDLGHFLGPARTGRNRG